MLMRFKMGNLGKKNKQVSISNSYMYLLAFENNQRLIIRQGLENDVFV